MPACRVSGAFLALTLVLAAPAWGQGAPTPLGAPASSPRPVPSAAPATSPEKPAQPEIAPQGAPQPGSDAVNVQQLEIIDPEGAGTLAPPEGFGNALWSGSDPAALALLITRLPSRPESKALQDLTRRVLLSAAQPPKGGTASLMRLRVEKLAARGDLAGAAALMGVAGRPIEGPIAARARVDRALLAGDTAAACADAASLLRETRDVYWQKLDIYCRIAAKTGDVRLALDVLRESDPSDAAFFTLANVMAGQGGKLDSLRNPTALHIVMLKAAKLPVPADAVGSNDPAVLAAIARDEAAAPVLRLGAAERAESAGILTGADLASIYAAIEFKPEEIANAIAQADPGFGPRARALLHRAALERKDYPARAEAIERALKLARAKGGYGTVARANAALIAAMPASLPLAFFAPEAARALIVANRPKEAAPWIVLAEGQKDVAGLESLLVLARLAGASEGSDAIGRWWTASAGKDGAVARASTVFAAADGTGVEFDSKLWRQLLAGSASGQAPMPPVAVLTGLRDAAAARRLGETVLYAAMALGEAVHPAVLEQGLEALRSVGLEADARRIATEAALAAGL